MMLSTVSGNGPVAADGTGRRAADWPEIVDTDELPRTAAATTRRIRRMNV